MAEEPVIVHDPPEEWSFWERYVKHRLDDHDLIGKVPGFVHPENCPDCAASPAMGRIAHKGDESVMYAMEQIRPFFSNNISDTTLLNIVMSAHMAVQTRLRELLS